MTVIFMIVPIIFMSLTILQIWIESYYLKNAHKLRGRVVGYESRSDNGRTKQGSYFVPIIEFTYKGERTWIQPLMYSNSKYFKIGQDVKLLALELGAEYVKIIGNKATNILIGVMAFISTLGLAVLIYTTSFEHFLNKVMLGFVIAFILFVLLFIYFKVPLNDLKLKNLKKSKIVTSKDFEEKYVFWNESEIQRLDGENNKIIFIVVSVGTIFVTFLTTFLWGRLNFDTQGKLIEIVIGKSSLDIINTLLKEDDLLILFLIFAGVNILVIYSFFKALKNINK